MNTTNNNRLLCLHGKIRHRATPCLLSVVLLACSLGLHANNTDLASQPLSNSTAAQVKPNLLLVLDASGSMDTNTLPDLWGQQSSPYVGMRNHLCNPIYYNPDVTYEPPVNGDGTRRPNINFGAAPSDGYDSSATRINLSTSFVAIEKSATGKDTVPQRAYYYRWDPSAGSTVTTLKPLTVTNGSPGLTPQCIAGTASNANTHSIAATGGTWTKVQILASDSDAIKANFANWYSYYSTRFNVMKTTLGQAFSTLDQSTRVGLVTAAPYDNYTSYLNGDPVLSTKFLAIKDFTDAQKTDWFNKLYALSVRGLTPTRAGLARAGRYYAGKNDGINNGMIPTRVDDPVQYACQKNFTLLASDGSWSYTPSLPATWETRDIPGLATSISYLTDNDSVRHPAPMYGVNTPQTYPSLADVAAYYYNPPDNRPAGEEFGGLRPNGTTGALNTDVTNAAVPASGTGTEDDKNPRQHMTTYTLGLGLSGHLIFDPDYKSTSSGDFTELRAGTKQWPSYGDAIGRVDDLWHAAVTGRGQYFSASDPESVRSGLNQALNNIRINVGASSGATSTSLEPTAGSNSAYVASYTTQSWSGDLQSVSIDLTTGTIGSTYNWSAKDQLNTLAPPNRNIRLFRKDVADNLVQFKWNSLSQAEQAYFSQAQINQLGQSALMSTGQVSAASGETLLSFIRGDRSKEDFQPKDVGKLFRKRSSRLGDIVNSQPQYIQGAIGNYSDSGYQAFKTAQASRSAMVYAGANDGMLHAFDAATGIETWAVIPSLVLPNLYKLADINYANNHTWLVDGTPVVADVYDGSSSQWKTILVGGLNGGGKGYYALDVTDPAAPKGLWEFGYSSTCYSSGTAYADCDVGYSYGNPLITKLIDGSWVAIVSSGYNNTGTNATGRGYLYVLNALTGAIRFKIDTGAGSTNNPSGLARIAGWADNAAADNTVQRVYAGDLLGNLWRFSWQNNNGVLTPSIIRLASLVDDSGAAQPITVKPELGEYHGQPYVYIGTGRYLGNSDIASTQTQSVYAIKDSADTVIPRSVLKKNVLTTTTVNGKNIRQNSCTQNCSSTTGWFVDLPVVGERVNIDLTLQNGTLVVASNLPNADACSVGGSSWINYFNYADGLAVYNSSNAAVGIQQTSTLVVGLSVLRLPNKNTVVISSNSDATRNTLNAAFSIAAPSGRRVSWRELN